MATTLKPVDAVLVGFGWTGAIMGQELCEAGLNVLALERGPWRDTATDFATGFAQDEFAVPTPADGATLYLKLRDDPGAAAIVKLPTPIQSASTSAPAPAQPKP